MCRYVIKIIMSKKKKGGKKEVNVLCHSDFNTEWRTYCITFLGILFLYLTQNVVMEQ